MRLKNKVAIVTGAASGIGQAIADLYVKEGAKVVYSDIKKCRVKGGQSIFIECDVSDSKQVDELIYATVKKFKKLDVMVNNAGIGEATSLLDTTDEGWQRVIDINLSGVFYGMRQAAKAMKKNKIKGSIINMSSILGSVGYQGALAYSASKGGVVQLTRSGAMDLAALGIRVNAIAPGFIKTSMTKDYLSDPAFLKMIESQTPLARVGDPIDIAYAALYLASDESGYVTGEVLFVDGGWRAR